MVEGEATLLILMVCSLERVTALRPELDSLSSYPSRELRCQGEVHVLHSINCVVLSIVQCSY